MPFLFMKNSLKCSGKKSCHDVETFTSCTGEQIFCSIKICKQSNMIKLKSEYEIQLIREAGAIVVKVIEDLKECIKAGITTEELDRIAKKSIISQGAIPAFKDYQGFPANICVSVNEEIVHGVPGKRSLKKGDIISLDVGVKLNGYFADAAVTVAVDKISREAEELIRVAKSALSISVAQAQPGNRLSDISYAIQHFVESQRFSVVRKFVGHGIGAQIHEEPEIPNFGSPGEGPRLKPGMVLAIEPMVTQGSSEVEILQDGWTAITKDKKLSAHFEHTVLITRDGPQILTVYNG